VYFKQTHPATHILRPTDLGHGRIGVPLPCATTAATVNEFDGIHTPSSEDREHATRCTCRENQLRTNKVSHSSLF